MKQFLLLALSLFATSNLIAQDDPKSRGIIDRLIAKNKGYTSFEAEFTSRLQDKASKLDISQSGTVKVRGKKFRLTLDDHTVMNDGITMWTYSKEANEVTISDPGEMDQELDPSQILTVYEKGFKSQFVDETKDASGATIQTIKLFPLEPAKKPYHTVSLSLDQTKLDPRTIQVLYKDGNVVTYTLKKFTPNVDLPEATFIFDKGKFPGVEVNDMR